MDLHEEFIFNQRIQKIWRDFIVKWVIINLICFFVGWILLFIPLIVSLILTALDYKSVSDKVDFLTRMHFDEQQKKSEQDKKEI